MISIKFWKWSFFFGWRKNSPLTETHTFTTQDGTCVQFTMSSTWPVKVIWSDTGVVQVNPNIEGKHETFGKYKNTARAAGKLVYSAPAKGLDGADSTTLRYQITLEKQEEDKYTVLREQIVKSFKGRNFVTESVEETYVTRDGACSRVTSEYGIEIGDMDLQVLEHNDAKRSKK